MSIKHYARLDDFTDLKKVSPIIFPLIASFLLNLFHLGKNNYFPKKKKKNERNDQIRKTNKRNLTTMISKFTLHVTLITFFSFFNVI